MRLENSQRPVLRYFNKTFPGHSWKSFMPRKLKKPGFSFTAVRSVVRSVVRSTVQTGGTTLGVTTGETALQWRTATNISIECAISGAFYTLFAAPHVFSLISDHNMA